MAKLVFDLTNLLAIILISVGVGHRFGWDAGVIVGGGLLMAVNFRVISIGNNR